MPITFFGPPLKVVDFSPAIGAEHITRIQFDEMGTFTTEHPLIIERFFHVYDSKPAIAESEVKAPETIHQCKKCEFIAETKAALTAHYKVSHPKV